MERSAGFLVILLAWPAGVAWAGPPLSTDGGISRGSDLSVPQASRVEPETEPAARRLNALLAEAQRNTALSRSPDPVLERHANGSYSFVGNGIKATIDADGRVHFHDSYISGFHFDLNAWLEHLANNDPYRSERRWFLERTQALRDQLANASKMAAARLTGKALERALAGVWTNPSLSCERRREETRKFWEAASSGNEPQAQRATIEDFLRQRSAHHPTCPCTAEDLRASGRPVRGQRALGLDAG